VVLPVGDGVRQFDTILPFSIVEPRPVTVLCSIFFLPQAIARLISVNIEPFAERDDPGHFRKEVLWNEEADLTFKEFEEPLRKVGLAWHGGGGSVVSELVSNNVTTISILGLENGDDGEW
jgi:hypothetical protein